MELAGHRSARREGSVMSETVAVFGAGIAGLSAAHELVRRGYTVAVYEAGPEAGGFFRSARLPRHRAMPSEYSWHGMGPWYHNVFDLMRQIPFDETGSVYEKALSRPIDFGIFPDDGSAQFYDRALASVPAMFRMTRWWEVLGWGWLMLKTWTARRRTLERYSTLLAAGAWSKVLGERAARTWRACFGPWIGSDWTHCSLHTAGQFFRHQLINAPAHHHPADEHGPSWLHGAGDGWLLLRGPSSEYWFDKWVDSLRSAGVEVVFDQALERLAFDGTRVVEARLASGRSVTADHYILATDPFTAAEIVARTPELECDPELGRLKPVTRDGPHFQVSFRIAFTEPIRFPRKRTAVVVADSEFNLTLFAQEQVWDRAVELGQGVQSLWTGTSCAATVPGRLYGLPVRRCTKEQFVEEVKAQILSCRALDELVRQANAGRGLKDFEILRIEVWHEWHFDPQGLRHDQRKWVNSTTTQAFQPGQVTSVPNLFLAGAHTRTSADVWSIEAAVESGRRAARGIDPQVPVLEQFTPPWLKFLADLDDLCYRFGAPHLLDLALLIGAAGVAWLLLRLL